MSKSNVLYCKRPDRDVPKIECGYPLPCPYHTAVIDETMVIVPSGAVPKKARPTVVRRLQQIRKALAK